MSETDRSASGSRARGTWRPKTQTRSICPVMDPVGTAATSSQVHEASVCVSFVPVGVCVCVLVCGWSLYIFICVGHLYGLFVPCLVVFACVCVCVCVLGTWKDAFWNLRGKT